MCVIGIISREKELEKNLSMSLYVDYAEAIQMGGGIPFVIAVIDNDKYIDDVINNISGLIIPGGEDINPRVYGEENTHSIGVNDKLDVFELKMIEKAHNKGIPILGICRGHQVLNVAFKGTLYQDVTLNPKFDKEIVHQQKNLGIPKEQGVHEINIVEGSFLSKLFGNKLLTNSFHHQAINRLGNGLKVAAYTSDNIIEAFENTSGSIVWGVEWHPEKTLFASKEQLILFEKFVSICRGEQQ